jgi:hypothetical protein
MDHISPSDSIKEAKGVEEGEREHKGPFTFSPKCQKAIALSKGKVLELLG